MGTLKDVMDGIDALSDAIGNMGAIIEAVQKGRGYLEKRYTGAKRDICGILEEMNKTLITMSSATSVLTHFSFIADADMFAPDLRAFNNRIVDQKAEIVELKQEIDEYRGHCSKIRYHADQIQQGSALDFLFRIFGIDSKEKNEELSARLHRIYDEELNHYLTVNALCDTVERAIQHVHETLGGPGLLDPGKVPEAAALLSEYGRAFMKVESEANHRILQIRKLIRALSE